MGTAHFFHQFAALLKADFSVQQSVTMAAKDGSPAFQKALREASFKIKMGQDLASSLSSRYFDPWTISLIRAAEYGGSLEETFERLAIAPKPQPLAINL
jgi:Type II secretory pathway, component PulF